MNITVSLLVGSFWL